MRLWHYKLIPLLSNQRILGQHRECCALRGKGWKRKHETVDYVFTHNYALLYEYHIDIIREMLVRNMEPDKNWMIPNYRGKELGMCVHLPVVELNTPVYYPEHDDVYLQECIDLLRERKDYLLPHAYLFDMYEKRLDMYMNIA